VVIVVVDVGSPVSFHRVVAAGRGCAGGGVVALAELLLPFPSDVSCGCGHFHHLRVGYSSSVLGAFSVSPWCLVVLSWLYQWLSNSLLS
jgi:hypothetical protein